MKKDTDINEKYLDRESDNMKQSNASISESFTHP